MQESPKIMDRMAAEPALYFEEYPGRMRTIGMTAPTLNTVAHQLCTWIEARSLAEVSDRQLLERFVHSGEEAAFAALLRRHGPMVLHVCYRVLERFHDAEDVFQATFLLLARKAKNIRQGEAVGSWLHGVAHRLAIRFQEQARRRQDHERRAADVHPEGSLQEAEYRELQAMLDDELQRLPAKYRQVLVLCYLEGQTQEEAAPPSGLSPGHRAKPPGSSAADVPQTTPPPRFDTIHSRSGDRSRGQHRTGRAAAFHAESRLDVHSGCGKRRSFRASRSACRERITSNGRGQMESHPDFRVVDDCP